MRFRWTKHNANTPAHSVFLRLPVLTLSAIALRDRNFISVEELALDTETLLRLDPPSRIDSVYEGGYHITGPARVIP